MRLSWIALGFWLCLPSAAAQADAELDLQSCAASAANGQGEDAVMYCSRAIESGALSTPDRALALTDRAAGYRTLRRFAAAIADCSKALELQPDLEEAHFACGNAYAGSGDYDRALASFDQAIALGPDIADYYNNRGNVHNQTGAYPRALADFTMAVRIRPHYPIAHLNRAIALYNAGRYGEAESAALAAIATDPGNLYAVLWLALAQRRVGEDPQPDLEAAARRADLDAWPGKLVRMFRGEDVPAVAVLIEGAEPSDQDCEASFYLGAWALADGKPDLARLRLERAAATCPKTYIERAGAVAELARMAPLTVE